MTMPQISSNTSTADLDDETLPDSTPASTSPAMETYISYNARPRRKTDYDIKKIKDLGDFASVFTNNGGEVEVRRLNGGTTNHIYRSIDRRRGAQGTIILKHAAEQLSSDPNFALATERMEYEAHILHRFQQEPQIHIIVNASPDDRSQEVRVRPVGLNFYDREIKLLSLIDSGDHNLKDAYSMLQIFEIQKIGMALGIWLAHLHAKTPQAYVSDTPYGRDNNMTGVIIGCHSYENLYAALTEYGHDGDLGRKINMRFGAMIAFDDECVCHGDFWPGNVVLNRKETGDGPIDLTVIDWELVRIGNSAADVGQFAAEAFLLDWSHGREHGLHKAFVQAYFKTSGVNYPSRESMYSWMTRVAIQFAVHIAFWPTRQNHWSRREDTKALVDLAVEILQDAISSRPDATKWRVFDGLPDLEIVAQDLMENRGSP